MPGLSFIPVNMHLLPNSMKIMVLNGHKELFVCIVSKIRDNVLSICITRVAKKQPMTDVYL